MKSYNEFCNEQAAQLFKVIDEHGGLLEWKKKWDVKGSIELPKSENGYYQGINLWKLLNIQIDKGLTSNTWLTFNQIKQRGGHVLKGAKGQQVCFFKMIEKDEEKKESESKLIPIFKLYTVFNLDQTSLKKEGAVYQVPQSLYSLLSILNVQISEFGNRAYYDTKNDVIVMPKRESFCSKEDYETTLLHELVHWSGSAARLDRECARNYSNNLKARAEEELVAEIGSVFLASYLRISGDLINHASYVAAWKELLDGKAVGRAMSQASKAFAWIAD